MTGKTIIHMVHNGDPSAAWLMPVLRRLVLLEGDATDTEIRRKFPHLKSSREIQIRWVDVLLKLDRACRAPLWVLRSIR